MPNDLHDSIALEIYVKHALEIHTRSLTLKTSRPYLRYGQFSTNNMPQVPKLLRIRPSLTFPIQQ